MIQPAENNSVSPDVAVVIVKMVFLFIDSTSLDVVYFTSNTRNILCFALRPEKMPKRSLFSPINDYKPEYTQ